MKCAVAVSLWFVSIATAVATPHSFETWSVLIKAGKCEDVAASSTGISCSKANGRTEFKFPPGIFEIDEQVLIPENVTITGASDPNNWSQPEQSPDYSTQTLFLATKGITEYDAPYCYAADVGTVRVGFVLSSFVTIERVSFQGVDTIRPGDNGALCGGGAFETKGCALNDCSNSGNNGGSDGIGSMDVTIRDVRINDYFHAADAYKIGAELPGNDDCTSAEGCCFCKPNGVRASQIGVFVPLTRDVMGTRRIVVENVVSRSTQADGINLHGRVTDARVTNTYIENTGDDTFVVWAGDRNASAVVWQDNVAVNPGVLRPNWYGNCVATYGLFDVAFENTTCRTPTLESPIPDPSKPDTPDRWRIDTSMFVFYGSFSALYPPGNSVAIRGWTFENLDLIEYSAAAGTMDAPAVQWDGKMVWTNSTTGVIAPFYIPPGDGGSPEVAAQLM